MHKKVFLVFLFFNALNNCSDVQQKAVEEEYLKKKSEFDQKKCEELQKHKKEVAQNIAGMKTISRFVSFLLKDSSEEVVASKSTDLKLDSNSVFNRISQKNT